ncbi:ATP-binding protein [Paraflavisolibacter sp. H34]|uniref:sensor histidine kinase n=1 Tax=Huijunlia imazamoxiresistens TaxID=3127457 RepID=UPI003018C766
MALHTTVCFLAFVICFLFLFSQNVFTLTVFSKGPGGFIARRLIPYIIVVPLALGFLRYQGERWGLYDTGFGVAIVVVGFLFTFVIVVVHQARHLNSMDQQRTAAENKVQQHARKLEQANQELEQFTYVSNHDLQEPLRKILTFADMVKADSYDKLTEASRKKFDRMVVAAHSMRAALKAVLAFIALNRKETFQPVDLGEVLGAVRTDLKAAIREKAATIQSEKLPVLQAVPKQMYQLFYNLVENSLKFSREGQPPVIAITCRKEPDRYRGYYEISVTDTGIGFKPEAADQIFVMFQRLHSKEEYPGTGMGLALCKKVVHNHGGKIWAEGQPAKGASFHVLLPVE